jgi:hypothetical protein
LFGELSALLFLLNLLKKMGIKKFKQKINDETFGCEIRTREFWKFDVKTVSNPDCMGHLKISL